MKILSIVVPVVNINENLNILFDSLSKWKDSRIEIVIVNQTQKKLDQSLIDFISPINVIDYLTEHIFSAAIARNTGANIASGKYIFFMDDDAILHSNYENLTELIQLLDEGTLDLIAVQRGEMINGSYSTHWPGNPPYLDFYNFPRYIIEWNLIVKKSFFLIDLGGFPEVGVGSKHSALSGEAFVLIAKGIEKKMNSKLLASIKVSHPGLFEKAKSLKTILGYSYGAGYAVSIIMKKQSKKIWFYWILRIVISAFKDLYEKDRNILTLEKINEKHYRLALARCKIQGFIDGAKNKYPKEQFWLNTQAEKVKKLK
ncbi:glycosyltransferase family 2 protein [Paenibacillus tengchongensis]|uniref:glycosyltransferase family 2 protein n=1 Tax=Paenibacillus tengchongensis TaxID=2608684 RepID=UPI00124DE8B2|nr:glycosyltransferase [Paenibacillus tengchongensis]